MKLKFVIASTKSLSHQPRSLTVEVVKLYNFGYAGRDAAAIQEHINELTELGLPAPRSIPALFQLPPRLATNEDFLAVPGADSYGEVEYALIRADDGDWYVTVASDHSDLAIEKISTAKSKSVYPDVLGTTAWPLAEVQEDWDSFVLSNSRTDDKGTEVVQQAPISELLSPGRLLEILRQRTGVEAPLGTLVLSGTIAGLPETGASRWEVSLHDPGRGRSISHAYAVDELLEELSSGGDTH